MYIIPVRLSHIIEQSIYFAYYWFHNIFLEKHQQTACTCVLIHFDSHFFLYFQYGQVDRRSDSIRHKRTSLLAQILYMVIHNSNTHNSLDILLFHISIKNITF